MTSVFNQHLLTRFQQKSQNFRLPFFQLKTNEARTSRYRGFRVKKVGLNKFQE